MPITAEQLDGLTSGLHAEAEKHFQTNQAVVSLTELRSIISAVQ